MIIIGLTGSIGMGKSFIAAEFARHGAVVFDADAKVHEILAEDKKVIEEIAGVFPAAFSGGKIDRKALAKIVFADAEKLRRLEMIIHPVVRKLQEDFIEKAKSERKTLAVLDIPLLFETGADKNCDVIIVALAPEEIRDERVLARENMDEKTLAAIKARQISDDKKSVRADYLINTGGDKEKVIALVAEIVKNLTTKQN